jgi:hypothetical protein
MNKRVLGGGSHLAQYSIQGLTVGAVLPGKTERNLCKSSAGLFFGKNAVQKLPKPTLEFSVPRPLQP